jgi:hypothetical protein
MCLKFAEMERRLGEIDRARAIYGHASQFCDPRTSPEFWKKWESFEVQHGNEDTYKEMLRIKRSVQAQYKYVHPNPFLRQISANQTSVPMLISSPLKPSHVACRMATTSMRKTTPPTVKTQWPPSNVKHAHPRASSQPAPVPWVGISSLQKQKERRIRMLLISTMTYDPRKAIWWVDRTCAYLWRFL